MSRRTRTLAVKRLVRVVITDKNITDKKIVENYAFADTVQPLYGGHHSRRSAGLQLYQYADDCQLYVSAPVDEASATVSRLSHCVTDVASWLSASRLRLNPAKTVLMWLGSRQQVGKDRLSRSPNSLVSNHHGGLSARPWRHVRQSSHHVSACKLHVSISVLFPAPASPSHMVADKRCSQNGSSCVYINVPGLLYLSPVRNI